MIIKASEIIDKFEGMSEEELQSRLDAAELMIRAYTHNNFQKRAMRVSGSSLGNKVHCISPFIKTGDTVQISQSLVNDGLYIVTGIEDDGTVLDKDLYSVDYNLVTKVEYPGDVVNGVIRLVKWDSENEDNVGVQSESISRHSVSYVNRTADNTEAGYPMELMAFLKPYMKARF